MTAAVVVVAAAVAAVAAVAAAEAVEAAAEAAGAPLPPAAPPQLPPLPPLEDEVVTPEEEEAISSIMQSGTVRAVSVPYTRDVAYQALLSTI